MPDRQIKRSKISKADKRLVLAAMLCMALMSLGMIWRFAQVNDMEARVKLMEKGIVALEKEQAALIIELKQLSAPRRIENRANDELGMRWPKQEQIIALGD